MSTCSTNFPGQKNDFFDLPLGKEKGPEIHDGKGKRYYHFHPRGIAWYKNFNHIPHVWYY